MDPFFAHSTLLSAGQTIEDNFTPHPGWDREMVAWSPDERRSLIERASDLRHAVGTALVGLGTRLQRPLPAAPGSEIAQ